MDLSNFTLPLAYLSGLVGFFSPCLIPLLPSYFAIITGFTLKDLYGLDFKHLRLRVFLSSVLFVAGFSLLYSLLGATGTVVGQFLSRYTSFLIRLSGFFLVLLGLVQLGIIKFKTLEFDFAWKVQKKLSRLSYLNAFITGIAMALIWIPCVGQILAAMLILASRQETALEGFRFLLAFSLGLGTPFFLLGLFFPWLIPLFQTHRRFLHLLNQAGGVLLIIFGLILVANQYGYYIQFFKSLFPFQ